MNSPEYPSANKVPLAPTTATELALRRELRKWAPAYSQQMDEPLSKLLGDVFNMGHFVVTMRRDLGLKIEIDDLSSLTPRGLIAMTVRAAGG